MRILSLHLDWIMAMRRGAGKYCLQDPIVRKYNRNQIYLAFIPINSQTRTYIHIHIYTFMETL